MKKSTKGALFSGLVFPGLGQIVLRRRQRGAVIVIAVLACLAVFVTKALGIAFAILESMELAGESIDMNSISEAATQASGAVLLNVLLVLVLLLWVFSVIDAYRIGKSLDQQIITSDRIR